MATNSLDAVLAQYEKATQSGSSSAKMSQEDRMKKLRKKGVKKDNYAESYLRAYGLAEAKGFTYDLYDIYKKGTGMANFPYMEKPSMKVAPLKSERLFFGAKRIDTFNA